MAPSVLTRSARGVIHAGDGSRPSHARSGEKGTRCGVAIRRQIRDCPRNCKRRASPDATVPPGAWEGGVCRDPRSQETCHHAGQSPGGVPRKENLVADISRRRASLRALSMPQRARCLFSADLIRGSIRKVKPGASGPLTPIRPGISPADLPVPAPTRAGSCNRCRRRADHRPAAILPRRRCRPCAAVSG